MTTLLHVETVSEGRSRVQCYSDAVLFHPATGNNSGYTNRYSQPATIFAMSLIGPEQAIRAIAAGCSFEKEYQRTSLLFRGPSGKSITAKWGWTWSPRAMRLVGTTMHMVIVPELTITGDVAGEEPRHVIIAQGQGNNPSTRDDLIAAIYQRLLLCYSTPILPIGVPAQPKREAAAALQWRKALVEQIIGDTTMWHPFKSHPEQTDRTWEHAGMLTMKSVELDKLVSTMTKQRHLVIPEAA